jgi:putative membrane protein
MMDPTERRAVEAAVRAAETRTRGEIYCVIARESSDYREVPLAWGALAALAAPAALLAAGITVSVPDILDASWSAAQIGAMAEAAAREALTGAILLQGVLFFGVAILVAIPPVRRFMTPRPLKREQVRRRAHEHFMSKNLAATRERTGVLIYVSAAERMAELLADDAIHEKVDPKVWDKAMAALVAGLKDGRPAEGFSAAIALVGDILAQHFPADDRDNPNELPDTLVVLP